VTATTKWTIRITTKGRTQEQTLRCTHTRAVTAATRWRTRAGAEYATIRPADPTAMGERGDWQQVYPVMESPRLTWAL
jgi:hypothetical protein